MTTVKAKKVFVAGAWAGQQMSNISIAVSERQMTCTEKNPEELKNNIYPGITDYRETSGVYIHICPKRVTIECVHQLREEDPLYIIAFSLFHGPSEWLSALVNIL